MTVQKQLWGEVFDAVTNIVRSSEEGNTRMEAAYVALLRAIYGRQEVLGQPAPFLTEALADSTDDAARDQPWWSDWKATRDLRNDVAHEGKVVTAARGSSMRRAGR